MKITSPEFRDGQTIPKTYTCDGKNVNPPLKFENIPKQTVTLALIIDDPDAPGGNFDHWLVYNIDSSLAEIKEEKQPLKADYANNGFGFKAYGGPCPPTGEEHRYFFKLYALSKRLELDSESLTKTELMTKIEESLIESAELMGKYKRPI